VAAGDAAFVHPALDEGAVFVDLPFHLAIRVVELLVEERNLIVVSNWLSMYVVFVNDGAPRMAAGRHLNFALRGARPPVPALCRNWIACPATPPPFVEGNQ